MHITTSIHLHLEPKEHFQTDAVSTYGHKPIRVLVNKAETVKGSGKVFVFGPRKTARGDWAMNWTHGVVDDLSEFPTEVLRALGIHHD